MCRHNTKKVQPVQYDSLVMLGLGVRTLCLWLTDWLVRTLLHTLAWLIWLITRASPVACGHAFLTGW
jgi:hypothetical protein